MSAVEKPAAESGSRRLILDTAARLLRLNGYHQTTLREIAEAVGIRKASLYYHFASKEEIVETVVNDGVRFVHEAVVSALAVLPPDAKPRVRLLAAIQAHFTALHGHGDYTSASIKVFTFGADAAPDSVRRVRRAYDDVWRALIAQLQQAGAIAPERSPEALRLFLLGAMNASVDWYSPGRFVISELSGEFAALVAQP